MSTMEVKIDNFSSGPVRLAVPVGTTVTWINRDDIPHTVVSPDESVVARRANEVFMADTDV
jgi:plastocyanin